MLQYTIDIVLKTMAKAGTKRKMEVFINYFGFFAIAGL